MLFIFLKKSYLVSKNLGDSGTIFQAKKTRVRGSTETRLSAFQSAKSQATRGTRQSPTVLKEKKNFLERGGIFF